MPLGPFALYHYCGASFHQVSQKAIGAGVLLADGLIAQFYRGVPTVEEASSIAVYILSKVKAQVASCGGFTNLTAFRKNGDFAFCDIKPLEALEKKMQIAEDGAIKALRKKICTNVVKLSWSSEHQRKKAENPTA
jgi:hypothetical protein